jgi:hypothetical protein
MKCVMCGRQAVWDTREYMIYEGEYSMALQIPAYWCVCGDCVFDEATLDRIQQARANLRDGSLSSPGVE